MSVLRRAVVALVALPSVLLAQWSPRPRGSASTVVGPPHGTVMVVGGGSMGQDIYDAFIKAAGGPDGLIIDVPNAGGANTYNQDAGGARGFRQAGAKNVYVLFTKDRTLADQDSFVAKIKQARGVWFEGGRQFHLVEDYGGTKTELAFMDVLMRGGVIGGSSAGASIIGDFMVRGAPSSNNFIMDAPGWEKGFGYLKNTGIDQHVVARERLPDLADSIIPRYPNLLAISEDEGTAWFIQGDTARIIGRNKAFVYNGKDRNDAGKPFLTLRPGDVFNLATRRVVHRAVEESRLKPAFVDALFAKYANASAGGATVLVAQGGKVFINDSYGIPPQAKYMPTTTVPQFPLHGLTDMFTQICAQMPAQNARGRGAGPDSAAAAAAGDPPPPPTGGRGGGRGGAPPTPLQSCVTRISTPVGWHKTAATADGQAQSNVDELYRLELGLEVPRTFAGVDAAKGWQADTYKGVARLAWYGTPGGKRNAFVRIPDKHAVVIILTNDDSADAKGMAERMIDQLLGLKG